MKTYWTVEIQLHSFLTSTPDESQWSALHPSCFTSGEEAHSTHWVDPRAGLDAV
jgi:hypothetical protein